MDLREREPFAQSRPRFTGLSGSPRTETTFPFAVATSTPQPTPQNRHGALSHFQVRSGGAPATVAETGRPAAAVATAAVPRNSRRLTFESMCAPLRPEPGAPQGNCTRRACR